MLVKLVTGNPNKLREVQQMFGAELRSVSLDLPEIQSRDLREIALDKVRRAFAVAGEPVMIEDVSAELEVFGGFPGPFVKFWEQAGGWEIVQPLVAASTKKGLIVRSGVAYKDAQRELYAESEVRGSIVPRSDGEGWGLDFYFVPQGETETYAQMGADRKNQLSHRGQAFRKMREMLNT